MNVNHSGFVLRIKHKRNALTYVKMLPVKPMIMHSEFFLFFSSFIISIEPKQNATLELKDLYQIYY